MNYVNSFIKKLFLLVFFTFITVVYSQSTVNKGSDIKVLYQFEYKKFVGSDDYRSDYAVLISNSQGSLFTFEKMMNLDSIQKFRTIASSDIFQYKPPYFYLIKRNNSSVTHYENIGNDLLKFEENVKLNWKLINEEKLIGSYKCKKATVTYGGRSWIAWYATEIPLAVGPYKFYGLPGIIMDIEDTEHIFKFSIIEIRSGNYTSDSNIKNYFITEEGADFQKTEKNKFYEIRTRFYEMSLNERLQYMNRENEGTPTLSISSDSGDAPSTNRQTKKRNLIER